MATVTQTFYFTNNSFVMAVVNFIEIYVRGESLNKFLVTVSSWF